MTSKATTFYVSVFWSENIQILWGKAEKKQKEKHLNVR